MAEEICVESVNPRVSTTDVGQKMEQMGWCPHQIKYAMQTYEPEVLSYLATINRSGFRDVSHHECARKRRCVAMNSKTDNYITRHVAPTCACDTVAVAYEEIIKILLKGGVPLISIRKDEDQEIHLHVEPRTPRSRYIAISHVWADGLGNPSRNALPRCQLERLHVQLGNLPRSRESAGTTIGRLLIDYKRFHFSIRSPRHTPLFWMDTLCIPVKEEDKLLRKRAINHMASVYAAAVQILVLDSELSQCTTDSIPAVEVLARILASSWMTRSWTLQEGVLGRECVYQFADAAIDPINAWCLSGRRETWGNRTTVSFHSPRDLAQDKLYRTLFKTLWNKLHQKWKSSLQLDPLTIDLSRREHFLAALSKRSRVDQLVETWNGLGQRSTTQVDDLLEIFANLLDFHAATVMKLGSMESGMLNILFSFKELPVSLLYNTGPRYQQNQHHMNRWVPVASSKDALHPTPTMKFIDTPFPGLLLDRTPTPTGSLVYMIKPAISDPGNFILRVVGKESVFIVECDRTEDDQFDSAKYSSTCIMFPASAEPAAGDSSRGACFHVSTAQELSNSYLPLVYDCPLRFRCYTMNSNARDLGGGLTADLDTDNISIAYTAEEVPAIVQIVLLYTPIPDFNPLPRRKTVYFNPTTDHDVIGCLFNLFLIAACLFVLKPVGVSLVKHHHSTSLRAGFSILLLFLCSIIIMATIGIIGNTLGRRPLSYRAWLLSFNEDNEKKEPPWWHIFIRNVNDENELQ